MNTRKNQIVIKDYDKTFEKDINALMLRQWNESFRHKNNFFGKIALVNNEFAGVCYGYPQNNYFYLNEICVVEKFRNQGLASSMLEKLIFDLNTNDQKWGGGKDALT